MAQPNFDYQGARNAGYSDAEINEFLRSSLKSSPKTQDKTTKFPNFDYDGALKAGYSEDEINEFLKSSSSENAEKGLLERGVRIGQQLGVSLAESALLPYELGVAPLASKEAMNVPYRESLGEDLENLLLQKSTGVWSEDDEKMLQNIQEQIKDPRKSLEFAQSDDIGVRGLLEKTTGQDLHPEGVLEKAASWMGYLKDPKKILQLSKSGITAKEAIKAIAPSGKEALQGLGAGIALQSAEEGELGPIGTMASAVIGDLAGLAVGKSVKGAVNLAKSPKQTLAKAVAYMTPTEKKALQQGVIKDFKDAGIQADLGTITDSNLVKWTQARLAQSGLTGKALDKFKTELTDQIKREYKNLADELGNARFASAFEAGEVVKNNLTKIRDAELSQIRNLYKTAENSLKSDSYVAPHKLAKVISDIESSLKPGSIKSAEQNAVLESLDRLKRDLYDSEGKLLFASVKELMNNKIALNDIINYEVQGGAKQLLKGVVAEIDRAIISHGKQNPTFAKNYILANKKFSEHSKAFRNKDISALLRKDDPEKIITKMNSVQGVRNLNKIFSSTPEGKELFNQLKRTKLDEVIGSNLVDSTTQQVKLGTFSKLLEKGKNKELVKELLSPQAFKRLERLQSNAGKLADAAQKFYNASKSGVVAADAAVIATMMMDLFHLLYGNPWPLLKAGAGLAATRKLADLLADPEFLKYVEEAIIASNSNNSKNISITLSNLRPYALEYANSSQKELYQDTEQ